MESKIFSLLEPKKNNGFCVKFPEEFGLQYWCVQKITKPKLINNIWNNIEIEFIDPIGPSTSQGLFKLIEHINKQKDNKCLFEFNIVSLGPVGDEVENWLIKVEEIVNLDFGDLDYSNNEIIKPKMLLKPLSCKLLF